MMPLLTSFQIAVTASRLLNWIVASPIAFFAHALRTTPSPRSTLEALCESSTGPPLFRRSIRQPFMSRMRSYSSPVRQSNRGTFAPVYQTASMVRASSLADGGAKVAATVKRSTWNSGVSC